MTRTKAVALRLVALM